MFIETLSEDLLNDQVKKVNMSRNIRASHLLFSTLLALGGLHTAIHAEELLAKHHHHHHEKDVLAVQNPLEPYLLPKDHPLQDILPHLFQDSHMFRSSKNLKHAGFKVKPGHRHLMVAFHPAIPLYLFKKFPDDLNQSSQLRNFIKRIQGANIVRESIKKNNCQHLVVPQKWLYELPKRFSKDGNKSYILIVENMDIVSKEENLDLYYHMDKEMLNELCIVLHDVGGCDAFPRNQPFTRSGKIAFIDTEHVGFSRFREHFIKHIVPVLSEDLQAYGTALWRKLEDK